MPRIRTILCLLLTAAVLLAQDKGKTEAVPDNKPRPPRALNKVFHGRVVKIKNKRVTIY